MRNAVQLITYADRMSRDLNELHELLTDEFAGLFGGVHILPFYTPHDGADAGFDPIDHTQVDPRLGTWDSIGRMSNDCEVMADVIVNHMSYESPQFQDWMKLGNKSKYADLFLTIDRIFPTGMTESDLLKVYRPRPTIPITYYTDTAGNKHAVWTTFTSAQVDIDISSPSGRDYLLNILDSLAGAHASSVRLDAIGYAVKKPGSSCFMIPETFEFIDELTQLCHDRSLEVLVEVHSYYKRQVEIAAQVDWVYDFALPPLVLHMLTAADPHPLQKWLEVRPTNAITVLDTHDGIGVIDVGSDPEDRSQAGLLEPEQINALVERMHENSGGTSRRATGAAASNLDLYQVNSTYYESLGRNDALYLAARAIQFFTPGIPQVYYVGLLAGVNDMELLERSGVGRDVNRHYYSREEIHREMHRPVVKALMSLIRLRNEHPAFHGVFSSVVHGNVLKMSWTQDHNQIALSVDAVTGKCEIEDSISNTTVTNLLYL